MNAIHINWTKPFTDKFGLEYNIEDFEILTTVLSALKWREHNGKIAMITDNIGYEYYKKNNLLPLWDNGVHILLDNMPNINTKMFWAAGKLWALKQQKAPVAMIDTDFIVWSKIAFNNLHDITTIHSEDIYPDVYPPQNHFNMRNGYKFDIDWDWALRPLNTAFCIIQNQELLEYYTDCAFKFMENANDCDDYLTYMVFAEQRLLPMCAGKLGIDVSEFSNLKTLFQDGEKYFTHIWGMKQQMRENERLRYDFCIRCANRIKNDFPQVTEILKDIDCLKGYFL